MTFKKEDETEVVPTPTSEPKPNPENADPKDTNFEEELARLEAEGTGKPGAEKPKRTELEKARFTVKSAVKRIKELGGDTKDLLTDEETPADPLSPEPQDTSHFVTKDDLAEIEAKKLAKSDAELKVIMWWVKNKGLSVADAHFMANKEKIQKATTEIKRAENTEYAPGGGDGGQKPPHTKDVPELSPQDLRSVRAANMVYDPTKKAYVGKKVQLRYDGKEWVTERI